MVAQTRPAIATDRKILSGSARPTFFPIAENL